MSSAMGSCGKRCAEAAVSLLVALPEAVTGTARALEGMAPGHAPVSAIALGDLPCQAETRGAIQAYGVRCNGADERNLSRLRPDGASPAAMTIKCA